MQITSARQELCVYFHKNSYVDKYFKSSCCTAGNVTDSSIAVTVEVVLL